MRAHAPEIQKESRGYLFLDGKSYRAGLVDACHCRLAPVFSMKREIVSRLHDTRRTI